MYEHIYNDKDCEGLREPDGPETTDQTNPTEENVGQTSTPPEEVQGQPADESVNHEMRGDGQSQAPKRRKTRKPQKLDPIKKAEICAAIAVGCSLRSAARLVGCSSQAIHKLANRDPEFQKRLQQAYMMAEFTPLKTIFMASRTHWRAAAWLLERLNRQEFGRFRPDVMTQEQFDDGMALVGERLKQLIPNEEVRGILREAFRKSERTPPWKNPFVEPVGYHSAPT